MSTLTTYTIDPAVWEAMPLEARRAFEGMAAELAKTKEEAAKAPKGPRGISDKKAQQMAFIPAEEGTTLRAIQNAGREQIIDALKRYHTAQNYGQLFDYANSVVADYAKILEVTEDAALAKMLEKRAYKPRKAGEEKEGSASEDDNACPDPAAHERGEHADEDHEAPKVQDPLEGVEVVNVNPANGAQTVEKKAEKSKKNKK